MKKIRMKSKYPTERFITIQIVLSYDFTDRKRHFKSILLKEIKKSRTIISPERNKMSNKFRPIGLHFD